MTTGSAPTGSRTPPICDAAEMWQLRPTCAQLPTSAWESTIVSSPTYAPTLMYMGGMQVTPRPTKQPSRMLEPPGTIRTPSLPSNCFTGYAALSNHGCLAVSMDQSTTIDIRNPRRIPFFTQGLTRQPVRADESGSAARISPEFSFCLNAWKSSNACSG